jgi:hypothetical protein
VSRTLSDAGARVSAVGASVLLDVERPATCEPEYQRLCSSCFSFQVCPYRNVCTERASCCGAFRNLMYPSLFNLLACSPFARMAVSRILRTHVVVVGRGSCVGFVVAGTAILQCLTFTNRKAQVGCQDCGQNWLPQAAVSSTPSHFPHQSQPHLPTTLRMHMLTYSLFSDILFDPWVSVASSLGK